MIPYSIQHVYPNDDIRINNIFTTLDCIEKNKLNETFINTIIQFMDEFCSDDYGHSLQINSYDDFCKQFWIKAEFMVYDWYYIFDIYYFENTWIKWNVEEYKEEIFLAYVNKYNKIQIANHLFK
jgi:hypothetical protein